VDGYSAIAPEDIAMFFSELWNRKQWNLQRVTKAKKRVTKNSYKSKEKQVGMANIT
jgi:hypothetical protein